MTGWLVVVGSLAVAAGVNAVFAVARRRRLARKRKDAGRPRPR